jgi:hypothetical protein
MERNYRNVQRDIKTNFTNYFTLACQTLQVDLEDLVDYMTTAIRGTLIPTYSELFIRWL